MPKTPRVVKLSPPKIDLYLKWSARLKANPVVAVTLILVAITLGAISFTEQAEKIPRLWNRILNRPLVMLSTGLYLTEVANQSPPKERVLLYEVRDLATGCPIVREETRPNEKGMWASPGPKGARVTLMFKIFIRNISNEKWKNVRLYLSSTEHPFDLREVSGTPNVTVKMARPPASQGGPGPYVIDIDALSVDDFAVITLSTPLIAADTQRLLGSKFDITFISFRADQVPSITPPISHKKLTAKEIYLLEGSKTIGKAGFTFDTEVEILKGTSPVDDRNLSFLWTTRQCDS